MWRLIWLKSRNAYLWAEKKMIHCSVRIALNMSVMATSLQKLIVLPCGSQNKKKGTYRPGHLIFSLKLNTKSVFPWISVSQVLKYKSTCLPLNWNLLYNKGNSHLSLSFSLSLSTSSVCPASGYESTTLGLDLSPKIPHRGYKTQEKRKRANSILKYSIMKALSLKSLEID